MNRTFSGTNAAFWTAVVALLLYRPVYCLGVPFSAFVSAAFDDGLMLRMALNLRDGQWLGSYDELTLVKGPFYPMFVAASSRLGAPLPVVEQGLYGLIALVAAWSVRPIVKNRWLILLGFALLVLNPYSWGTLPARFTRDPMAGQMALLCMAGLVGMILRRDRSYLDMAVWGSLAGVAGAACWMTREEGIWIVGPAMALGGIAALSVVVGNSGNWRERLSRGAILAGYPVLMGTLPLLSVCAQNYRHYGLFAVVELKTKAFEDAYGAMLRVGQKYHRPYVPVSEAARDAIAGISPTFREIKPYFDGEQRQRWLMHRAMPDPQDIQGGWFIWALRYAVSKTTGPHDSPPLDVYRKLADEVNAACDAGTVPAGLRRSGMAPPLLEDDKPRLRASLARYYSRLLWWERYQNDVFSMDDSSSLALAARDLVHAPLTGAANMPLVRGWACAADGPVTLALLRNGESTKFKAQWLGSPDVADFLKAGGHDWPSAQASRFEQSAQLDASDLVLYRADKEIGRINLRAHERLIVNDKFAACVDDFRTDFVRAVSPRKNALRQWVAKAFYTAQPVFTAAVAIWFAIALWNIRRHFMLLCITGAVAGAILVRTGLLAYIDATTYTIPGTRYAEPTYTLYGYLMVLAVASLAHHFSARQRGSVAAVQHISTRETEKPEDLIPGL